MRYYACESLYNIAKVAREGFVCFFSEVDSAILQLQSCNCGVSNPSGVLAHGQSPCPDCTAPDLSATALDATSPCPRHLALTF